MCTHVFLPDILGSVRSRCTTLPLQESLQTSIQESNGHEPQPLISLCSDGAAAYPLMYPLMMMNGSPGPQPFKSLCTSDLLISASSEEEHQEKSTDEETQEKPVDEGVDGNRVSKGNDQDFIFSKLRDTFLNDLNYDHEISTCSSYYDWRC